MESIAPAAAALVGLALGALVATLVARAQSSSNAAALATRLDEREREARQLREQATRLEAALAEQREVAAREAQARAALEQALRNEQGKSVEQARLLEEAQQRLSDTFKALAADALRASSESFLQLAQQRLTALQGEGRQELESRQRAIELVLQPVREQLKTLGEQTAALDRERRSQQGVLDEQLRQLARETRTLSTALRQPHVRGKWGELTLRRVVELAGMSQHCDFEEQVTVDGDEGRLRPDLVVHLPSQREIVIDAKTTLLLSYTEAVEAESEEARVEAMRKHAQAVRTHIQKLAQKQYWDQFERTPEFVVLFLYNEAAFGAALHEDPELFEYAMANKVVIATPTTLIALLRAVAYGWRQEQLTQTAQQISDLGKQLFDRMATFSDHMRNLGRRLEAAVEEYNKAVGSLENRVLPGARKFKELGAVPDGRELELLTPVDQTPRTLNATLTLFEEEDRAG